LFEEFVAAHRERAVGLAWRLLAGDLSAAEDVVQDSFARAHRSLHTFRGESQMSTWFYRIVVRQAANHRRARGTRLRLLDAWRRQSDVSLPQSTPPTGDARLRTDIQDALKQLTHSQREAFVLVHLEQFTTAEAAELMGVATGTAKSHLHRALVALRATLAEHWEER
jgi:RNA polymerase sigma-70 factor (ECF subfamily)